MIVTIALLAHDPLVITLQHLRMACGRKMLESNEWAKRIGLTTD